MAEPERGSVLIVDDEESLLGVLEQFLTDRGYRVETAATGREARERFEASSFDVALIDLKLPDCSGLDVIGRLRTESPDTRTIVMTAYASLESTIESLRYNVSDYVIKPFDLVKIGEHVDAAYHEARLERDRARRIDRLEEANRKLEKHRDHLNRKMLKASDELAHAHESLQKHVTRLKMLYQMGRDISSNENWSDALDRFLMALCTYLEAEGAGLLMFSGGGKVLTVRTAYQLEREVLDTAVTALLEARNRDTLRTELFDLARCTGEGAPTCLELKGEWELTGVPLLYKGRWLGFIVIKKRYRTRRAFLGDYHFINTMQTILTEEVANAAAISGLRTLKDFNETILENIGSGVLTTDRGGRIVFVNRRAREMLGEAAGREASFNDLFPNPHGSRGSFEWITSGGRGSRSFEGTLSLSDGTRVPIRLNATVVEPDEYHGRTIVAVFDDLTEQRALEEELRRADRLRSLGELSAGVAHEIRNPLTGIATTAQVLRDKLRDDPEKARYLSIILDEINRLDGIITNLLSFARPRSPRPEEISLGSLIEESLQLVADAAAERGVRIRFENVLAEDRCFLDRDQIKQVFLNVALNGVQACRDGGELSVRLGAGEAPASIVVAFTDTGEGIPDEVSDKLYDPFFTTRPDGTGLGLAITRKIIESHGGTIRHHSEAGAGTRFSIELPRRITPAPPEPEAAAVT